MIAPASHSLTNNVITTHQRFLSKRTLQRCLRAKLVGGGGSVWRRRAVEKQLLSTKYEQEECITHPILLQPSLRLVLLTGQYGRQHETGVITKDRMSSSNSKVKLRGKTYYWQRNSLSRVRQNVDITSLSSSTMKKCVLFFVPHQKCQMKTMSL